MRMKKLTPILYVTTIEPSLEFWVDGLRFKKTMEVPAGDKLGFVGLERDGLEIMLQTHGSMKEDLSLPTTSQQSSAMLYIEVDDLEPLRNLAKSAEIVVPERTTFYGMREIAFREPGGQVVVFAIKAEK